MFELTITNNLNSSFGSFPEKKRGFSGELHNNITFTSNQICIHGLRYRDEINDFLETEIHIIAIVGKVFYRLAYSSNLAAVGVEDILNLYIRLKDDFSNNLKGNFIITIFNKKENTLLLIKDSLGLKYLYYKFEKNIFFISTNLSDFKHITKKINYAAVIEKILFTYPIGRETFLEDVFMLEEGGMLRFSNGTLSKDTYSSIDDLFVSKKTLPKFDKEVFLPIFEKSVKQRANVSSKINASLTGGFDGRTNIAVLLHNKINFHAYSFGKQGGENTKVPLLVAAKLGLDYEPIFLDSNFEQCYAQCALDVIDNSDGISNFERANYIFSMHKLVNYAQYNITGLIGGEIFAPVHLKTDYINSTYFDVIYNCLDLSFDELLIKKGVKNYINKDIIGDKKILQKIKRNIDLRRTLVNKWKKDKYGWLFYLKDFMTLGFRMFYGNQMHLERYFNENLSPFYDIDVIEYVFSTNHLFSYQHAFKESPLLRRKNRKLQTLIISRFSKELATIPVDRGYPPGYTTDIRMLMIPFLYFFRRLKRKGSEPEFDSPTWSALLYKDLLKNVEYLSDELLNIGVLISELEKYKKEDYNKTLNHLLSIAIWLKQ